MNAETALILVFVFGGGEKKTQAIVVEKTQTIVSTRQASGHSHTCPNNNCPIYKDYGVRNTWDHTINKSHKCQYCDSSSYVVSNNPVTVLRTVKTIDYAKTPREAWPEKAKPLPRPEVTQKAQPISLTQNTQYQSYGFPVLSNSSGCANGQCSTVVSTRSGWRGR